MYFTAVLAIAANLLTPEQWVSYQRCCYDENGNVMSCALASSASSRSPVIREACCDPITHQLRTAPAPVVNESKTPCNIPHFDAIPAPVPPLIAHISEQGVCAREAFDTGPLENPELLSRHCRFNI